MFLSNKTKGILHYVEPFLSFLGAKLHRSLTERHQKCGADLRRGDMPRLGDKPRAVPDPLLQGVHRSC